MFRLLTYILSAALFCSNVLPAATQTLPQNVVAQPEAVVQPQPQEAAVQNPENRVENFLNFNGPQNLNSDDLGSQLKKTNVSLEKIANSLSQFTIKRMTFSILSSFFFAAGLFFMYHNHKMQAPLSIPPITRLQDIIKLKAKYFLVNDILSTSMLFFLLGTWALKKVCDKPEKEVENPAEAVVAPVAVPVQAGIQQPAN